MSVIGAQSGITGSPMSAATGAMIALLAVKGVTPLQIFSVAIPACLLGVLIGCAFMFKKGKELADDPEFQRRVMSGEFQDKPINTDSCNYSSSAKKGVIVFALGILAVVFFGSFPDLMPSWAKRSGKVTRLSIPNMVQIVMLLLRRLDHGDCQCLSEEARRRFRLPLRFNRHGRSFTACLG